MKLWEGPWPSLNGAPRPPDLCCLANCRDRSRARMIQASAISSSCCLCIGSRIDAAIWRHSAARCWYSETLRMRPPGDFPMTKYESTQMVPRNTHAKFGIRKRARDLNGPRVSRRQPVLPLVEHIWLIIEIIPLARTRWSCAVIAQDQPRMELPPKRKRPPTGAAYRWIFSEPSRPEISAMRRPRCQTSISRPSTYGLASAIAASSLGPSMIWMPMKCPSVGSMM